MKIQYKKGFTLIELLVVIAIIGLLSSIVLVSLNTARAKGRDSSRIQALVQLRTALELYKSANGTYPIPSPSNGDIADIDSVTIDGSAYNYVAQGGVTFDQLFPGLAPKYISNTVMDGFEGYIYGTDGKDYHLTAGNLETMCGNSSAPESSLCDFTSFASGGLITTRAAGIFTNDAEFWVTQN